MISITLIAPRHIKALFTFESANRDYFSSIGLARHRDYYHLPSFRDIAAKHIAEQRAGKHYMYLLWRNEQELVGRVNLTEVMRKPFHKAEIGYRIGEAYQGQGIATRAVGLVLSQALHAHNLHRIEANTTVNNTASQHVLLNNGFRLVGKCYQYIQQDTHWQDGLLFEKILDA